MSTGIRGSGGSGTRIAKARARGGLSEGCGSRGCCATAAAAADDLAMRGRLGGAGYAPGVHRERFATRETSFTMSESRVVRRWYHGTPHRSGMRSTSRVPFAIDAPFPVGRIAQLVEQLTLNQRVPGSSPGAPTKLRSKLDNFRPAGVPSASADFVSGPQWDTVAHNVDNAASGFV